MPIYLHNLSLILCGVELISRRARFGIRSRRLSLWRTLFVASLEINFIDRFSDLFAHKSAFIPFVCMKTERCVAYTFSNSELRAFRKTNISTKTFEEISSQCCAIICRSKKKVHSVNASQLFLQQKIESCQLSVPIVNWL